VLNYIQKQTHFKNLVFWSLFWLALGTFTSLSLSALSHIFGGLALIVFLISKNKSEYFRFEFSNSAITILVISFIMFISLLLSDVQNPFKNFFKFKYFFLTVLFLPVFNFHLHNKLNRSHKKFLINLFIFATTLATLSGIIGLYSGYNPLRFKLACHPDRACGMYGMPITYGYGISIFCSLLLVLILKRKENILKFNNKYLFVALFINLVGLYLSYTRGAWIGFVGSLPFLFINHIKTFIKIFISIFIVSILAVKFVPKINDAFTSIDRKSSNSQRLSMYQAALKGFQEKPVLGYGYRNFESHVKSIKERHNISHQDFVSHSHNNYLEFLVTTGGIGFILLLFFLFFWVKEIFLLPGFLSPILLIGTINIYISGLFQYTFGDGENLFIIMLVYLLSQLKYPRVKSEN
jgi:O-antigen ligase